MKTYKLLEPVRYNGKKHMPPGEIELEDDEASRLIGYSAIAPVDDGQLILEPDTPSDPATSSEPLTPSDPVTSSEPLTPADALTEQADKNANQNPLNNKDGGDATPEAPQAVAEGEDIEGGVSPDTAATLDGSAAGEAVSPAAVENPGIKDVPAKTAGSKRKSTGTAKK